MNKYKYGEPLSKRFNVRITSSQFEMIKAYAQAKGMRGSMDHIIRETVISTASQFLSNLSEVKKTDDDIP